MVKVELPGEKLAREKKEKRLKATTAYLGGASLYDAVKGLNYDPSTFHAYLKRRNLLRSERWISLFLVKSEAEALLSMLESHNELVAANIRVKIKNRLEKLQ